MFSVRFIAALTVLFILVGGITALGLTPSAYTLWIVVGVALLIAYITRPVGHD